MPSGIFRDLTGNRYGRLVVLNRLPNLKGKVLYECQCDCGNKSNVRADSLEYKRINNTRSCGCLQKEASARNGRKSRKAPGEKLINDLFTNYKRHARIRKINWNLEKNIFIKLIFQKCFYCGIEKSNKITHQRIKDDILFYNGVDRVDSNLGYEESNCVSCCGQCNYSKSDYTKEEFLNWVKLVYQYNFGDKNG